MCACFVHASCHGRTPALAWDHERRQAARVLRASEDRAAAPPVPPPPKMRPGGPARGAHVATDVGRCRALLGPRSLPPRRRRTRSGGSRNVLFRRTPVSLGPPSSRSLPSRSLWGNEKPLCVRFEALASPGTLHGGWQAQLWQRFLLTRWVYTQARLGGLAPASRSALFARRRSRCGSRVLLWYIIVHYSIVYDSIVCYSMSYYIRLC